MRLPFSTHAKARNEQHEVPLAELQETVDHLTERLAREEMDRQELLQVARSLEPLARNLDHALHDDRMRYGGREKAAAERSLQELWDCLYAIRAYRPYTWSPNLQKRIRHALSSVNSALILLKWSQLGRREQSLAT